MLKVKPGKEIVVKVKNHIGVLDDLLKRIAEKGVNVLAAGAWVCDDTGVIHLLTEDNLRAADALRAADYKPVEADVVVAEVSHKPGMLRHITERLARDLIDIHHLYASASGTQDKCLIVFATSKNDRAIVLLNA